MLTTQSHQCHYLLKSSVTKNILKEYLQVARSRSQHKELGILVNFFQRRISPKRNAVIRNGLKILSKIAEIQPQVAYSAYTSYLNINSRFSFE